MLRSLFLIVLCSALGNVSTKKNPTKVLLISMDGFSWSYLDTVSNIPNFERFAREGCKAPFMHPAYPTDTFPVHYTIITGLYVESHGITDNRMYDPVFNDTFGYSTVETRWWNAGEPLWVTAKKQGLRTGSYYWVGSSTEIQGIRPDIWFEYSNDPPYKERVDAVVDWFKNQDITFATLYMPEPDYTGHRYGPDSPELKAKVRELDDVLGYLMEKLKNNSLDNDVNIVLTSDHGMTYIDVKSRLVDISDYVDMTKVARMPSDGAMAQILPVEGAADDIFKNLTDARIPHIKVYMKEDMPERYHYKMNRRIMPIVIIADEGWMITSNKTRMATYPLIAQHGYDNRVMSMKPIFLARGPSFKRNYHADPMESVDIYPLLCELLDIEPAPNNGSLNRVANMIRVPPEKNPVSGSCHVIPQGFSTWIFVVIMIIFVKFEINK